MLQCPKCKLIALESVIALFSSDHNSYRCNSCGHVVKKEVVTSETSIKKEVETSETSIIKQEKIKLIKCSDCEKEISVNADACPHCGAPTELKKNKNSANQNVNPQTTLVGWGVFFIIFGVILFMTYMTIGKQYLMNNLYILMNGNVVALYNLWFYGSFVVGILGLIFIVIGSTRK